MDKTRSIDLAELMAQAPWLRRIAGALVADAADAEDIAQGALVAALQTPPLPPGSLRPWLARVASNLARMGGRGARRRRLREEAAPAPAAPLSPEAVVLRAELHALLARLVVELSEPYRTTLLLRYFEDLTPAEIAARTGAPAGTVRWRLKRGLEQLRLQLDRAHDGQRGLWAGPLAALGVRRPAPCISLTGGLVMKKLNALLAVILVLLLAGGAASRWVVGRGPVLATRPPGAAGPAAVPGAPARAAASAPPRGPAPLALPPAACAASVFGTARDSQGGVIVGARLRLLRPSATFTTAVAAQDLGEVVAVSGPEGRFEVCLPAGHSGFAVEAEGYGGEVFWTPGGRRLRHDVTLAPEATVIGRVVRLDDEAPIAGARVEARAATPGARLGLPALATADPAGRFELRGLSAGRWRLLASAPGLTPSQAVEVQVEPARPSGEVLCRMEAASRLRGVVLLGDQPLAGVRVTARSDHLGRDSRSAVSAADGSFVLEETPGGPVTLQVEEHEVLSPLRVHVAPAERSGPIHRVQVAPLGEIAGTVVRAGAAVAAARVVAQGAQEAEAEADAQGRFALRGLRPGSYSLSAWSPAARASAAPLRVVLQAREHRGGVRLELAQAASVAGVVLDQRGAPVVSALVRLLDSAGAEGGSDTTVEGGRFLVEGLGAGVSYAVRVSLVETGQPLRPASGAFPLLTLGQADERRSGVQLAVQRVPSHIAGQVVDEGGAPLPDVRVAAVPQHPGEPLYLGSWREFPTATSDSEGRFAIADLAAGTYGLHALGGDGSEAIVKDVRSGRRDVRVVMQAAGGIDGALEGFTRPPEVVAGRAGVLYMVPVHAIVSGATFRLRGLPPARYEVRTSGMDEGDSTLVEVRPGQIAKATLRSRGGGSVAGRVFEFRSGQPVADAGCRAWFQNGVARVVRFLPGVAWTDSDGRFALPGVPAGAMGVTCWREDEPPYSDGIVPVTVVRGEQAQVQVPVVRGRPAATAELGLRLDVNLRIAVIAEVSADGPAERAGLQRGDVIAAVDGADVSALSWTGVRALITDRPPGSTVVLGVRREGRLITAAVVSAAAAHGGLR